MRYYVAAGKDETLRAFDENDLQALGVQPKAGPFSDRIVAVNTAYTMQVEHMVSLGLLSPKICIVCEDEFLPIGTDNRFCGRCRLDLDWPGAIEEYYG